MNYDRFIEMLRNLNSTEEVLITLYNYFKNNVKYNYDQLQTVKYQNGRFGKFKRIYELLEENPNEKSDEFKENLIKMLDEVFLEIEGRPLTERNKSKWFGHYGEIIHHEAIPPFVSGLIKFNGSPAFDEVVRIRPFNYEALYNNGMLEEAVCAEYSSWIKKICDQLNIPCLIVYGKGSTGHEWNLIYLEDKNIWVNFDMTMVRFYLDGWTKEYGEPEKWVFATNDEMFNMQPNREVYSLRNGQGHNEQVVFKSIVKKENVHELKEFLQSFDLKETQK